MEAQAVKTFLKVEALIELGGIWSPLVHAIRDRLGLDDHLGLLRSLGNQLGLLRSLGNQLGLEGEGFDPPDPRFAMWWSRANPAHSARSSGERENSS